jgi:hypothetical protein
MVHSAMVASIAGPIATRRPTAVDPRTAIRGLVRQLQNGALAEGPAQPFEKARFAERKELGFCFPWLGFCFLAWVFLPEGLDFPSAGLKN